MMKIDRRELLITGTTVAAAMAAGNPGFAENNLPATLPQAGVAPQPGMGSADISAYAALTNEKRINVVNLRDLEAEAKKILPPYSFAYISGGSGDEWTMRHNESAFDQWVIEPHFLAGVKTPDLTTTILGSKLSFPVITAPMGGQGIAHALKEIPTSRAPITPVRFTSIAPSPI